MTDLQRAMACAEEGDFSRALSWCSSVDRIPFLENCWSDVFDDEERLTLFASAIESGDFPSRCRAFIVEVVRGFVEERLRVVSIGERVHTGQRAEAFFRRLPPRLHVFRGACEGEVDAEAIGTSWSLSRHKAVWFACSHSRCRNTDSPPVILDGWVSREFATVYLNGRKERELVLDPDRIEELHVERVPAAAVLHEQVRGLS